MTSALNLDASLNQQILGKNALQTAIRRPHLFVARNSAVLVSP